MFCCILLEIYVFSFPFNFPQVVFNSYFLSDVSIVLFWNYPFSRRNIGTNREKSSVFCFLVISYGILLTSRSQNTRSIRLSAASFSFWSPRRKKEVVEDVLMPRTALHCGARVILFFNWMCRLGKPDWVSMILPWNYNLLWIQVSYVRQLYLDQSAGDHFIIYGV